MCDTINILFLGGAKRVSMARHFKAAARAVGMELELYSYELTSREPIAEEACVIEGRRWNSPYVVDELRDICRRLNIRAVVPFVDGAVAVAAALADVTFVPAPDADLAETMFDKVKAAALFESLDLPVPETCRDGIFRHPLIAKPRHGSASKGLIFIESQAQLDAIPDPDNYLIQRHILSREEITVDCYVDTRTGEPLIISPRIRLEVSGGEVTRTRTLTDDRLTRLTLETLRLTGLRGAITVQILYDLHTKSLMIMEINPRLGGGAVCSVAAGADLPACIINEALGRPAKKYTARPDVEIARYPQEVVFS